MSSPPIFLQLQHVNIQGHFEHAAWSMLRRRTAMNDVMTTKIEPHGFIYVLFLQVWSSALAGSSAREAAPL